MNAMKIIESVGISGILDIIIMSVILYSVLVWFKRTRAAFVVIGMFILGVGYLLARQMDLALTISVFQGFFAIILIAVVIIFQEEIKHLLEQLASRSMIRNKRLRKITLGTRREIDILVNSTRAFARERIGAIIVLRGKDPIGRQIDGGVDLNGELSEALLGSIFMPGSPGHDGAVIIEGATITAFACYLPLSKNLRALQKVGTRHAAALGLVERTDALCIVISEERGTISIAYNGAISALTSDDELPRILEAFYRELDPPTTARKWTGILVKNRREKILAFAATVVLWFFFVHEARIDYRTYKLPVLAEDAPAELMIKSIDPPELEVTFSGPRRSFYFTDTSRIHLAVKLGDARQGTVRRTITRSNVFAPEGLYVENIQPSQVAVLLGKRPPQP